MKIRILVISLFSLFICNGQTLENSENEILNKAEFHLELFYNVEEPIIKDKNSKKVEEKSKDYYQKKANEYFSILVDKFPNSEKISYYLFSKGSTSSTTDEAKSSYERIIELNNWDYYTRKSYIKLASYSLKEKKLEEISYYLKCIEKMEKPTFTCGTEKETYESQLKNLHEEYKREVKK